MYVVFWVILGSFSELRHLLIRPMDEELIGVATRPISIDLYATIKGKSDMSVQSLKCTELFYYLQLLS